MTLPGPVVGFTADGARALGRVYWAEVERSTLRLVRSHNRSPGTRLSLVGGWPTLLRLGEPELEISPTAVVCRYPIEGGVLVRRRSGDISFAQDGAGELELLTSIRGFYPMLAARTGRPGWTGALYEHLQSRAHVAISRRYFARLLDARAQEAQR